MAMLLFGHKLFPGPVIYRLGDIEINQPVSIIQLFGFSAFFIGFLVSVFAIKSTSWIIPSLIMLVLSVTTLLSLIIKAGISTQNVGDFTNILIFSLTGISVFFGILGIFFGRKLENLFNLAQMCKDVAEFTVISAELAICTLPDFAKSHQIPEETRKTLEKICAKIFVPNSPLLKHLEEVGNGNFLRYTKGIWLFAENKIIDSIREFLDVIEDKKSTDETRLDVIKDKKSTDETRKDALYRLGIAYRQNNDWERSLDAFLSLADNRNITKTDKDLERARLGVAITFLAGIKLFKTYDRREIMKKIKQDL